MACFLAGLRGFAMSTSCSAVLRTSQQRQALSPARSVVAGHAKQKCCCHCAFVIAQNSGVPS